jgi:hypothetical protein
MKFSNALSFLAIGGVMLALPSFAPGLCAGRSWDGSSARELWLHAMGGVQFVLGAGGIAWRFIGALAVWFETWPQTVSNLWDEVVPESGEIPADSGASRLVPIKVESDWSEQRRAA